MKAEINNLSKSQLLFIINTFVSEELENEMLPEAALKVKPSKIDYDQLRDLLIMLVDHSDKYRQQIAMLIRRSIEQSDHQQVIAMDPVSGLVSITAMFLFYKFSSQVVDKYGAGILRNPTPENILDTNRVLDHSIKRDLKLSSGRDSPEYETDILLLTIVPAEYQAVIRFIKDKRPAKDKQGGMYTLGTYHQYRIAVRQVHDQGNPVMALEAERAIEFLKPKIVLLIGIAGGINDKVKKGDVIVVSRSDYLESGKETPTGLKSRLKGGRFNFELYEKARFLAGNPWIFSKEVHDWPFNVVFGPLVAGEKVITTGFSPVINRIDERHEDALGVAMEGFGLLLALHARPHVKGLEIRGVSDFPKDENKDMEYFEGGREKAAEHAGLFAFALIDLLEV